MLLDGLRNRALCNNYNLLFHVPDGCSNTLLHVVDSLGDSCLDFVKNLFDRLPEIPLKLIAEALYDIIVRGCDMCSAGSECVCQTRVSAKLNGEVSQTRTCASEARRRYGTWGGAVDGMQGHGVVESGIFRSRT